MKDRIQYLNIVVLSIVVFYTILIQKYFIGKLGIGTFSDTIITFFSSIGAYRFLIFIMYATINNNDFLLKLYWNKRYIKGLWEYSYSINGKTFYGVWRIDQDLFGTEIRGFGLDDNFKIRSKYRSVSQLVENQGAFDILSVRNDTIEGAKEYYSKATMWLEYPLKKDFVFYISFPKIIRSQTIIYGGRLSESIHHDVLAKKNENAKTEEDIINCIKSHNSVRIMEKSA